MTTETKHTAKHTAQHAQDAAQDAAQHVQDAAQRTAQHAQRTAQHAQRTAQHAQDTAQNLFDQAFKTYEQALNTGIKIQEETVNLWKNVLCDSPTPSEMQKRLTAVVDDGFPAAKKRMAESLRAIEEQYNVGSDLMQKAVQFGQPGTVAESQARIRDIWESSLTAVRNNAQSVVKTNQQILDFWTGVLTTGVRKATATK